MDAIDHERRYVVSTEAVDCPLGDGIAILDTRTNNYFSLNATGAAIWNSARTSATPHEMSAALAKNFDCSPEQCSGDVAVVLASLLEAGLLRLAP